MKELQDVDASEMALGLLYKQEFLNKFQKKLEEHKKKKKNRVKPSPPRYDADFFEFLKYLDKL